MYCSSIEEANASYLTNIYIKMDAFKGVKLLQANWLST